MKLGANKNLAKLTEKTKDTFNRWNGFMCWLCYKPMSIWGLVYGHSNGKCLNQIKQYMEFMYCYKEYDRMNETPYISLTSNLCRMQNPHDRKLGDSQYVNPDCRYEIQADVNTLIDVVKAGITSSQYENIQTLREKITSLHGPLVPQSTN